MSKNNQVGNIPIETPMLKRILKAAMDVYIGMSEEETKALNEEIKVVTETNRSCDIYDIAKMLEDRVDSYCKNHLSSY
ncbi:MAG: hypothetical protein HDR24_13095 [Lachnospiraceae bacterium]|nr:hypothetical protein [Lachnospiraceae bacterium]